MMNQYVREFISGAKFDYDLNASIYYNRIRRNPFYRVKLIPSALKHGIKCVQNWRSLNKTLQKGHLVNAHLWR